jgi:hypothetical protein
LVIKVVISIHGGCIAASNSLVVSYQLGLWYLASAIFPFCFAALQSIEHAQHLDSHNVLPTFAWMANSMTVLFLALTCSLIPRRPDEICNNHEIDHQRFVSLLSKHTWSWIEPLLWKASAQGDLHPEEIPHPDHALRAECLKRRWDAVDSPAPLSRSLIWRYKKSLGLLWLVTVVRCLVGILPFWALLKILNMLESRQEEHFHSVQLLSLIFAMAVSNLLDAVRSFTFSYRPHVYVLLTPCRAFLQWMEGWLFWSSVSDLSLPLRTQLSSLIFAKSLRRKDVRTAKLQLQDRDSFPNLHKGQSEEQIDRSAPETKMDESR